MERERGIRTIQLVGVSGNDSAPLDIYRLVDYISVPEESASFYMYIKRMSCEDGRESPSFILVLLHWTVKRRGKDAISPSKYHSVSM